MRRFWRIPVRATLSGLDGVPSTIEALFHIWTTYASRSRAPPIFKLHVLGYRPAQFLEALKKRRVARMRAGIVRGLALQHADAAHPLAVGARRERPRRPTVL